MQRILIPSTLLDVRKRCSLGFLEAPHSISTYNYPLARWSSRKKKLWRSKRNSQISKHTQKEVPKAHEVCKRATVKQLLVVWMREAHIESCLNFWSPADGIVWEWLEVVALLEEGKNSRGQISKFQMPPPVPSDVQVSYLRIEMWVIDCCFSIILACLLSSSPPRWWWSLSSRKCKPQINPSFYTLLWCFVTAIRR